MISLKQAIDRVNVELARFALDDDYLVIEQGIREYDWGWVFHYNTRTWIETGDDEHALIGNAPYLVNRQTGELAVGSSADEIELVADELVRQLGWVR